MLSTITPVPAQSPNSPSTHSELNGAIACITSAGHYWPCCGGARIAACRRALRFGRAEGSSYLSAKNMEKERKKNHILSAYLLTSAWPERWKAREEGTLPADPVLGAVKHPQLPAMTGSTTKQCVLWRCAPSQGGASSHGNLLQSSCEGEACWVMQEESNTTSHVSIPWEEGVLGASWTAGVASSATQVSPPVKVDSSDCTFASFPARCRLWGVGSHMLLSRGAAVLWICHRGESQICTAALHNERLGFHVYGF